MANFNFIKLFNNNTESGAVSDTIKRDMYSKNAIQFVGASGDNTCDIEASLDGTNWVKVVDTVASDTIVQLDGLYRYLRVKRVSGDDSLSVVLYSGDYSYV